MNPPPKQPETLSTAARVLLVDDKPENLRLLAEMLSERGYRIQIARSGDLALRAVEKARPDIVLLDIDMPGTNGLEVCRRLQDDPGTRSIPVIFVTALARTEEKVRGLQLGGVDYVTKPFQLEEVVARMETHLELKRLRETLAIKVDELQEKNERLDLFARALAHDLRGPLGVIMGYADLAASGKEPSQFVEPIRRGAAKMKEIIDSLILLALADRADQHFQAVDMGGVVREVTESLAGRIEEAGARLEIEGPLPAASGQAEWVERVYTNLLSNAVKYGGDPPVIRIGAEPANGAKVRYWVEDNGAGLTREQKERLFVPFSRLDPEKAEGIGLGLVIVQKIVEKMGGEAGVEDGAEEGSRFWFTLPVAEGNTAPDRTSADTSEGAALAS